MPARTSAVWRVADFRRLWVGDSVSQLGSSVTVLALPLVAITLLHATAWQVGLLAAAQTVPFLIVGLPAGAWVDRMSYRAVLVVNDVVRAAAIATVPIAALLGALSIEHLILVGLITGTCRVFFDVAYQSFLPTLVEREQLIDGNAALQASQSVSEVVGPGLAGLLIKLITGPWALAVDAGSFLWSALWLGAIRSRRDVAERPPAGDLRGQIAEGLRFVLGHPLLRAITTTTAIANFFSAMTASASLLLLARVLHLSPGLIGVLSMGGGVGGVLASLVAGRIAQRLGQGRAIWLPLALAMPLGIVTPFLTRSTAYLFAVIELAVFFGVVVYNINQVSFRQAVCPRPMLGRMNATIRFVVFGAIPLGSLFGGGLASVIGVRGCLLVAALGGMTAFVPVVASPLRRLRDLSDFESVSAVAELSRP